MTFAQKALKFFLNLHPAQILPGNIKILNPYENDEVRQIVKTFFKKYFNDENKRVFLLGINPGRFGGGLTGIAFTDPITLEKYCLINNSFIRRTELSSRFVYSVINEFGGVEKFYSEFFISALYPLALVKNGKNYNYYNSKEIYNYLKKELLNALKKQIEFGAKKNTIICLGKKNYQYLIELNREINYFKKIIILEHPRFIMQYRLKKKDYYIKKYIDALESTLKS